MLIRLAKYSGVFTGLILLLLWNRPEIKLMTTGRVVFLNQQDLLIELAMTKKQRAKGLMFRESLNHNHGMLFVFDDEGIQRVWMKNTLMPLDVVFMSIDKKVVSIFKHLQPCARDECIIYSAEKQAKYMLELNAGEIDKRNIVMGQVLNLHL